MEAYICKCILTLGGSRPRPPTGRLLPIIKLDVSESFQLTFLLDAQATLTSCWPLTHFSLLYLVGLSLLLLFLLFLRARNQDECFEKTTGNLSHLPPLQVPRIPDAFRPPSDTGSGEVEVTYLDADTRVTRGDLRVFVIS
ncbi:hypothetical protein POTOM_035688 [Populus tomentosa]|uniref:Plastid lipid-associated protein/fibrillin conserved domain-containing protein n=1 Tax=Populus tomentosa TaxID=118781 RepID=A0A8X8CEE9_POPTO|nr:hypothetical protein POTOM_035688 [Populus tomentosa]